MLRVLILIASFLCSLSLLTVAYSQTTAEDALGLAVTNAPGSECEVGSQLEASVDPIDNPFHEKVPEHCGAYTGYIQGACCCDVKTGQLTCLDNIVCQEVLRRQ